MKPIIFNTDMVKAILDGRKTVTRRVVKIPHCGYFEHEPPLGVVPPYRTGDVLYVRETWNSIRFGNGKKAPFHTEYWYKADDTSQNPDDKWRPSIHMPKEAARIFLRVAGVRPERLRDMTEESARAEGFANRAQAIKAILAMYPNCTEDSWFWVNEFERISKGGA